jgi:hypothetical protein
MRGRNRKDILSWAWWYMPVIPELRRLKQEDCEFEVTLRYTATPCLNWGRGEERKSKILTN